MGFLNPWAVAIGVVGVGLPLAIHWLTRPRPTRLPLSTVRFVLEAIRQRRARHRIRDILILALRALAVVLLAWAFSRPLSGDRSVVADASSGRTDRIVVLDQSQSMASRTGGIETFERARATAAGHLAYRPGLSANLVLSAARARGVFEKPSRNFTGLREALSEASPRPERLDVQAALAAASEMFAMARAGDEIRRELVIISDFQRANWAAADFSVLPKDARIQLEYVGAESAPANLAVLRVAAVGRAEPERDIRIDVDVGNYSATPRQVGIELTIEDSTYRVDRLCPPGGRTTLKIDISPSHAGWQSGTVRLTGVEDALPADDTRPFVLEVRPVARYALITREPASHRPSSSYFIERALVPRGVGSESARSRVFRLGPDQVDRESLRDCDLIVLVAPGKLDRASLALLASLVRRGRPMLYVAGEPIDATNLRRLGDALGSDWQMPVEFAPPTGSRRTALFLAEVGSDRLPFRVFGDQVTAAIAPLRFDRALSSRRVSAGLEDDVLAYYSDRSAFLVSTACGAGVLAVLNADVARSTLPSSPLFVPLLGELATLMLGSGRPDTSVACGEASAVYVSSSGSGSLRIEGPTEAALDLGELIEEDSGVLWSWSAAGPPGVYRVVEGERTAVALASAIPSEEGDLRTLDPAVFKERLVGGRVVGFRQADAQDDGRDDVWTWFAVACVLCMLTEIGLLKVFRT